MVLFREGKPLVVITVLVLACALVYDDHVLVSLPYLLADTYELLGTASFGQHLLANPTPRKTPTLFALDETMELKQCSFQLRVQRPTGHGEYPLTGLYSGWSVNTERMVVIISRVFELHTGTLVRL